LQVDSGGQLRGDDQDAAQRTGSGQAEVTDPGISYKLTKKLDKLVENEDKLTDVLEDF
jgi:hypothetical protein